MKRLVRWMRYGIGLLLAVYALSIVLLQLVWRTPALEIWWIQLLNIFGLWLYLPLLFALLLAPFARPRRAKVLLLLPALCFVLEYGSLFLARPSATNGVPLRVMTWNILYRNNDIEAIAATILAQKPDVVALQELSRFQSEALAPILKSAYPYSALDPAGSGTQSEGLGVWSRYPMVEEGPTTNSRANCECQRLLLDLDRQALRFVNVHTMTPEFSWTPRLPIPGLYRLRLPASFSTARQEPAIEALADEAAQSTQPLIMAGDFNTSDRQGNYWRLRRYLADAFRGAGTGFGLTFPNIDSDMRDGPIPPLLRIDYIFHSPTITTQHAFTIAHASSDHRAVVADLVIGREPQNAALNSHISPYGYAR